MRLKNRSDDRRWILWHFWTFLGNYIRIVPAVIVKAGLLSKDTFHGIFEPGTITFSPKKYQTETCFGNSDLPTIQLGYAFRNQDLTQWSTFPNTGDCTKPAFDIITVLLTEGEFGGISWPNEITFSPTCWPSKTERETRFRNLNTILLNVNFIDDRKSEVGGWTE